jgi:acyl-coenzyme A thioesterase PaaI-like protein
MLWKQTALLQLFGFVKIPLIAFTGVRVERLDSSGCEIVIPLSYRTKNHLGSMYFGALAVGADCAAGLNAAELIRKQYPNVSLVFANFSADFSKRADGDVHFSTNDGKRVRAAMAETFASGERVTLPVKIVATVPRKYGEAPVATFTLGLSLKRKKR